MISTSEKFQAFVLGKEFIIETDHKPLVPIFNSKNLNNLPPRVLRTTVWNISQESYSTQQHFVPFLLLLLTSLENEKLNS